MIRKVHITNSRCLRDVELELGPLTALVGANASGKSALIWRLTAPYQFEATDFWQRRVDLPAEVTVDFADGSGQRMRWGQGEGHSGSWRNWPSLLLRLDLDRMRDSNEVARHSQLATDGRNLANVFATLTRKQQEALAAELNRLVPVVSDVIVRPTASGHHQLQFQDRWNEAVWYTPHQVSDGTILITAFLTLQFMEAPIELLAIEEPERALHPFLLEELVKFLRQLATQNGTREGDRGFLREFESWLIADDAAVSSATGRVVGTTAEPETMDRREAKEILGRPTSLTYERRGSRSSRRPGSWWCARRPRSSMIPSSRHVARQHHAFPGGAEQLGEAVTVGVGEVDGLVRIDLAAHRLEHGVAEQPPDEELQRR